MLRRLSVIAASAAMLAASALPAFATTHTTTHTSTHTSTHKLAFPSHSGISAWGTYKKTNKGIYVNVCAKDTKRAFAVGAVVVATNSSGSRSSNLGAVAMGHNQTQCRFGTIPYSSHLKTYVIGYTSHGTIAFKTGTKKLF
jgi:D-serine deaminase-like pyridoxal phosphate-dependent protein